MVVCSTPSSLFGPFLACTRMGRGGNRRALWTSALARSGLASRSVRAWCEAGTKYHCGQLFPAISSRSRAAATAQVGNRPINSPLSRRRVCQSLITGK